MKVPWTDQLSVGNALIDSDHKNLMDVIGRIEEAIRDRDRIALSVAFELFDAYMQIHTENEEEIAAAIGYAFAQDKMAQRQSMGEMKYMINKLETISDAWPDNVLEMYSRFLREWIGKHILTINMPMKAALQACPYDYIPGVSENSPLFQTSMVLPIKSYTAPKPPIW